MNPNLRRLTTSTRGLLTLGLVIREGLSFWTGHPYDMEVWLRNAYFVSRGANPYTAWFPPVPGLSFAFLNQSLGGVGYLPLWPLIVAGLYRLYVAVPGASRFFLYFLLKQPPVLADVLLGFLMYRAISRWSGNGALALRGLRFWMLFPYAILISGMWGMFDAIIAVLLFAFLLSVDAVKGYSLLGLGILLKWLPLIYLPYYALRERGARKLGGVISLGLVAGLTALIFYVTGWDYAGVTAMSWSMSHGGGNGITYVFVLQDRSLVPILSQIPGFYFAMGYLWPPGIIVAGLIGSRRFPGKGAEMTVQALLLITVVFLLTRWGVYEQYLTYLLPLFYIDVAIWHPERKSLFRFTWVLAFLFLLANNDLLLRFFGPVSSQAVNIAFAADNESIFGPIRTAALYIVAILFTLHLVQLVLTFLNPSRNATPWLFRLGSVRRSRAPDESDLTKVGNP